MSLIAEDLAFAMQAQPVNVALPGVGINREPGGTGDLLIRILKLTSDRYPGREMRGVLPIVVTGHAGMNESEWNNWVRRVGIAHYGAAYTERVIRDGIDLKEMLPTAGFGRQMRARSENVNAYGDMRRAENLLAAVEKWPSLYNLIVDQMEEQEMTLSQFMGRIYSMPTPYELGAGAFSTLGDILPPKTSGMILPGLGDVGW